MVEWRPIIIGIIFTVTSYVILSFAQQGGINGVIVFLLGGVLLGFTIKPKVDYNAKAKHLLTYGLILGIISSLITIVILLIQAYTAGLSYIFDSSIIIPLLEVIASDTVAVIIGVIVGNFTREEYTKSTLNIER